MARLTLNTLEENCTNFRGLDALDLIQVMCNFIYSYILSTPYDDIIAYVYSILPFTVDKIKF